MELNFSKTDLGRLVRGDWELVCGRWKEDCADKVGRWLTIKSDGLYLSDPENTPEPWVHPGREGLVLPLPTFTLEQFKSFCDWHPTFEWEAIESVFTNDDGTLDEDALKELASRGEAAAALVRGVLAGADDEYLTAWETSCQIDECRAEIAELKSLKPTTITERTLAKQELAKLEIRLAALLNPDAEPGTTESPKPTVPAPQQPKPAAVEALPAQPNPPAPEPQTAPPAPVVTGSASDVPPPRAKAKRRTWQDVSASYIVEVMRAGRYTTAKELYRDLASKAGAGSPFEKGTGNTRGTLFVRDIAESLSLKTVQNNWKSLRELAEK